MSKPVSDTLTYQRKLFLYQILEKIYSSEQWVTSIEPDDFSSIPGEILEKVERSSLVKFHNKALEHVVRNLKNEDDKIREIEYTSDVIFKILKEIEIFSYYRSLANKKEYFELDISLNSIGFSDLFLRDKSPFYFSGNNTSLSSQILNDEEIEYYAREVRRRSFFNRPVCWLIVVALIFVEHQNYSREHQEKIKEREKLSESMIQRRFSYEILLFLIDIISFSAIFSVAYYLYSNEDLFSLDFLPIRENFVLMGPLIFLMLKIIKKSIFPNWAEVFKNSINNFEKEDKIISTMGKLHNSLQFHNNAESIKSEYTKSFDVGIVYNSHVGLLLNDFISKNITFEPFDGFGTPFRKRFDP
jgi:hypothetical protein